MTAWLAFTASTVENGCLRCVPGTHRGGLLSVTETFAKDNMLSRGQEVDVPEAEAKAVDLALLLGLIGLLVLALGAGCGRRIRDFLCFVYEAPYDESNRPR